MSLKLTAQSFVAGLKQSGLIDPVQVDPLLLDLQRSGVDCSDSVHIAQALVQRGIVTEWQSEKLLQGKHKGFRLGRYRLLNLLGAGEMSAVYLAEHTLLERRCAIKVLPGNKVRDTSYLGRFHREAKAVAALDHPNIVRAYDVDQQTDGGADIHFLVMEYVEGASLEQIITQHGRMNPVEAADCIRQAAEGLQHAHLAGMVHRDVKPGNLLRDKQGIVKILDLGLARFFKNTEEESLTIKHDEKVLGTADYLAPEQAIDSHKVDARADIYSLGCTFYFALTGHPPFTDGTLVQRLLAHQTRTPKSIRSLRPDLPVELAEILEKMMAKQAAARYQTAAEVAQALTQWLIASAPAAWQEKNLSLVAQSRGLQAILTPPVVPTVVQSAVSATPEKSREVIPHTTAVPVEATQQETPVVVQTTPAGARASERMSHSTNPSRGPRESQEHREALVRETPSGVTKKTSANRKSGSTPRPSHKSRPSTGGPAITAIPKIQVAAAQGGAQARAVPLWTTEALFSIPVWQFATIAGALLLLSLTVLLIAFSIFSGGNNTAATPTFPAASTAAAVSILQGPLE